VSCWKRAPQAMAGVDPTWPSAAAEPSRVGALRFCFISCRAHRQPARLHPREMRDSHRKLLLEPLLELLVAGCLQDVAGAARCGGLGPRLLRWCSLCLGCGSRGFLLLLGLVGCRCGLLLRNPALAWVQLDETWGRDCGGSEAPWARAWARGSGCRTLARLPFLLNSLTSCFGARSALL
jgi:hypothetical protein